MPVGRNPALTDDDLESIRALRVEGIGYKVIGRILAFKRKSDGEEVNRSPALIKDALSGNYETLEAYERRARRAREQMLARAVLGLGSEEEVDV